MPTGPLLESRAVSKYFGRTVALESVSFSVEAGESLFVTGGNGAGKSTLLALLAGTLLPQRGEILINGISGRARTPRTRASIGYAGAQPGLYAQLSIEENLIFFADAYSLTEPQQRISEVIAELDLHAVRHKLVSVCSMGIVRRAALARVLLHSPQILILDEPTANLDLPSQIAFGETLIRARTRGAALIVSSHEEAFVSAVATRVITLRGGRIDPGGAAKKAGFAVISGGE